MSRKHYWIAWLLMTVVAACVFCTAVSFRRTSLARILLPGETTHGHYQIELACDACHTEFLGVKQDACAACHAKDLERDNDTHPAKKFNDPTNADRLLIINAQQCITCHREHVPNRTQAMGLSLPNDYCFHCHEDVGEQRPSHIGMKHDSCQNAGCHNYHDNRALYEKFLYDHAHEPALLDSPNVAILKHELPQALALQPDDADAPNALLSEPLVNQWAATVHAAAGVNCRACHDVPSEDLPSEWRNDVDSMACRECHATEYETFLKGRHGMRLAQGMTAMKPAIARLEMHDKTAHQSLNCSACHQPHRYDTRYAAAEACMSCHNDQHTNHYRKSEHYKLWLAELAGDGDEGTGVSCATCHMPREEIDGKVRVQHNQNDNLRPNEKMIRNVCMNCHGVEYSLSALADPQLIDRCFDGAPQVQSESVQMAVEWFESKEKKRRD